MTQLDLDRYVPFFLSSIGNKLSRGASRVYLARFGVGVNEWRLLANLKVQGRATAGAICQASGIDKAAASRAVGRLDALGCIDTIETRDGRARLLALTPAGEALHDRIIDAALERERVLLTGFDEAERTQLIGLLRRLYANVGVLDEDS
jgi:DNA-binding MarR family transcriptional regulator